MSDEDGDETEYAHDTKVIYCDYKAKDVYDEKTLKDFADDLPKLIEKKTYEWNHKKIPTYNTIRKMWFKRWKWKKCAESYVRDITEGHKDEALLIYYKKLLQDTIDDFQLIESHKDRIKYLRWREKEFKEDWTYKIVKLEEAISSIWKRICERLGVDETKIKLDASVESTVKEETQLRYTPEIRERIQNQSDEPDEETQKFLDEL